MKKVKIFLASLLLICSQVAFANDPKQVASSFLNWCAMHNTCDRRDDKETILNNPNLTDNFKQELIRHAWVFGVELDMEYDGCGEYVWDDKKSEDENRRLCKEGLKKWLYNLSDDRKNLLLEAKYIWDIRDGEPIFYGNDYPEEFIVEKYDAKSGYVLLKGKDWNDYKIYVKVIQKDGKYLIDGAGSVNIPSSLYYSIHKND